MIEQIGTAFPPGPLGALVGECMRQVKLPPEWVRRIVVVAPEEYDALRLAVSNGVAQPLGPGITSLGWTWAERINGNVLSTIILPAKTVTDALASDPCAFFTVSHEMGHAVDFRHRDTVSIPDLQHNAPFLKATVNTFYTERFVQEFEANRHAAESLSPELIHKCIRHVRGMYKHCREIIQNHISGHNNGEVPNFTLAYQVSICAWEILVAIGSVHGYLADPADLARAVADKWDTRIREIEQLLVPASRRFANEQPIPTAGANAQLQGVWTTLMQNWGFSFVTSVDGDRITYPGHP